MNRDDAIRKIRAMLSLAKAKAATPGEVANALALASKLMAKFDLSPDMVESCRSTMIGRTIVLRTRSLSQWNVAVTTPDVSRLTGTACAMSMDHDVSCRTVPILIVGYPAAVEFAEYVYTLADRACIESYEDYRRSRPGRKVPHATMWPDWVMGFGAGVSRNIVTMLATPDGEPADGTARALIRADDHILAQDALFKMFGGRWHDVVVGPPGAFYKAGFSHGVRTQIRRALR